jgi:amidase
MAQGGTMGSLADETRWLDATDQAELVSSNQITPLELLEAALDRAERINPSINALTWTWFDRARDEARALADSGQPLRGVPFILKDLHAALIGTRMSNGNPAMKQAEYICDHTTTLVQRYLDAGLLIFGRGNSPEFGATPTTEPEAWGPTRNPWDLSRTAGGSSGGSAAAVAAGIVPAAHASDGGGSIRVPAACCGLVGLKVSQGRITAAPNRDETNLGVEHVVTRTVRDCAALLDATHGPGIGDRVIAPQPLRPFTEELTAPCPTLRIGFVTTRADGFHVEEDCVTAVHNTVKTLQSLGHRVEESWPKALDDTKAGTRFLALWSTNMSLARNGVERMLGRAVTKDDFELMNWTMAEYAKSMSATDYAQAVQDAAMYRRAIAAWWSDGFDILVTPTTSLVAVPLGEIVNNPASPMDPMRRSAEFLGFTQPFNVSGQPAISLPLHRTQQGVPVGIQLVAAYGREDVLLRLSAQLEQATPWANYHPNL